MSIGWGRKRWVDYAVREVSLDVHIGNCVLPWYTQKLAHSPKGRHEPGRGKLLDCSRRSSGRVWNHQHVDEPKLLSRLCKQWKDGTCFFMSRLLLCFSTAARAIFRQSQIRTWPLNREILPIYLMFTSMKETFSWRLPHYTLSICITLLDSFWKYP